MPTPDARRLPPVVLAVLVAGVLLSGCLPANPPRPVPSVAQIGSDLKCANGDHGYEDQQAGWGFCYPSTWKYTERAQSTSNPQGLQLLDLTFDITCVSDCKVPCPSGAAPAQCTPQTGLFSYMIISTYQRGDATSLSGWLTANGSKTETVEETIGWGNSLEAARLSDGKRVALTQHHVVILDLHSGLLDLEGEMSSRLGTWKFLF